MSKTEGGSVKTVKFSVASDDETICIDGVPLFWEDDSGEIHVVKKGSRHGEILLKAAVERKDGKEGWIDSEDGIEPIINDLNRAFTAIQRINRISKLLTVPDHTAVERRGRVRFSLSVEPSDRKPDEVDMTLAEFRRWYAGRILEDMLAMIDDPENEEGGLEPMVEMIAEKLGLEPDIMAPTGMVTYENPTPFGPGVEGIRRDVEAAAGRDQ